VSSKDQIKVTASMQNSESMAAEVFLPITEEDQEKEHGYE